MQEQLILNRYRPISEAGSGGFAKVQLAWDTRIQRRVAIKCIQLREEDMSLGVPPGLEEARTAALLTDNTIVGVYDFEIQGAVAYLIMEYIDGLTLTQLLNEYGSELSLNAIAALFSSVARALEIAHDNQVLHLDIKPDNVLINRQGQVKVTDFGLATLSDAVGFGAANGGTIGYMPPEQMRRESLDARSDEWALASMTYEMLTGKNPFLSDKLERAEAAIMDAELVLPSLCKEGLAAAADDAIFYALDPDRNERYDQVVDFAEEMEKFLGNPIKGQRELAVLVGQASEEQEDEEEAVTRVVFFDRLGEGSRNLLARLWSLANAGILSFVALSNIPEVGGWASFVFWGLFALFAIAAVFKPHLGAILSLLVLCVSLFMNEAVVVAILLLLASGIWWFFVGRMGNSQSNTALAPSLFASFGFNQITPLIVGFTLSMKDAVFNTLFTLFLSIILAGFGSQSLFGWNAALFWNYSAIDIQALIVLLLQQPTTWCIVVSWLLAAVVMRLFCLRQTRLFAFFGTVIATSILAAALCLAAWLTSAQASWLPEWFLLVSTIGAGIVMSVICSLGVPLREKEEQ